MSSEHTRFNNEVAAAFQIGFKERGWGPHVEKGATINNIIRLQPDLLEKLQFLFSKREGGLRPNNNQLYGHYKRQAGEYLVQCAKNGI